MFRKLSKVINSWFGAVSVENGSSDLCFFLLGLELCILFTGLLNIVTDNNSNRKTFSLFRHTPD